MRNKIATNDLAVFGGEPCFSNKLHVGCPNIGDEQAMFRRFHEVLERRWLSNNGPCVQELEEKLAAYTGVKHCVITCNATVALELAIRALGLTGEVILPSFTFIATAHALQWQEITPVFCDVDPLTHTIDPKRIEQLITPRTTGIIGVHLWGRACDVEALAEIAHRRKLKLLFDAAHAFGCSHRGKMIGGFGRAEIFSFHATKFFNTSEGGAIMTNEDELAHRLRLMRNFGFEGVDNVVYLGTNGKMNEVSAAMGLTNLESLPAFIRINRSNYELYWRFIKKLPGIRLVSHNEEEQSNFQYIVLEVDESVAGISRDTLIEVMSAENVMARRYFHPGCHRMEPYRSYYPNAALLLPNTERLCRQVMSLPSGTATGADAVTDICALLKFCLQHALEISERLTDCPRKKLALVA
ncbi:MAG: aminotransferase class I/II-fold pyridoxal phosphate-dependent enzyme [Verrucomicrobia bacterium]|nr:aminotransferase class I/II-fold pyridoxal phosphate-dependent enzyme [Verrucomicrobiota bacterium]